jgi:hypothetical protein
MRVHLTGQSTRTHLAEFNRTRPNVPDAIQGTCAIKCAIKWDLRMRGSVAPTARWWPSRPKPSAECSSGRDKATPTRLLWSSALDLRLHVPRLATIQNALKMPLEARPETSAPA